MFWFLLTVFAVAQADPIRICVLESAASFCTQMSQDLPETFECIVGKDTHECIWKIAENEADVVNVDPNGLYLGGKFYGLRPVVTELVNGNDHRYQGIALVSKNSNIQSARDLQGKKSCHTGFWRTVGWQIPVSKLLSSGIMHPSCDEGELASVNNFFDTSCVPGNWSTDAEVDRGLKEKFPGLCAVCKDPATCSADDEYAGYQGVMRCLSDGAGDVAFTKIPALNEFLEKDPSFAERAEILCFEGGRKEVTDESPCTWGFRPTNSFIARDASEEETERIVTSLLDTQARYAIPQSRTPEWYYKSFLSNPKVTGIKRTEEQKNTYDRYLGDFLHTIHKPRPGCGSGLEEELSAKFCVISEEELEKCECLSKSAEARGIWPNIRCIKADSKAACMENLKEEHADLLVLDGGDVYKGGRYFHLVPLAAELYNGTDANYYAVAVLRSASDVSKLSQLKGLRSCHTGIGRTAGWVMPVGVLLSEGLLSCDDCNRAAAVADFFSGGSCVPGANDTKYNPGRVRSEDLCKQCVGDEQGHHKCARDSKERYSGYAGALRCLVEGAGDVAFVKHSTVPQYTDDNSELSWARDLISSDFKLLCDVGETSSVTDHLNCNLGKVPSHHVVTGGSASYGRRLQLSKLLADVSRYFSNSSTFYRIFGSGTQPDLLFKDATTGLRITPLNSTYEEVLGQRFLEASIATDTRDGEVGIWK